MRRYSVGEIEDAFRVLDEEAAPHRRVVVLGGAAIAMHTRSPSGTKDIDTWESDLADLATVCRAKGIDLPPISMTGVAEMPWNYDERLERVLPDLKHLAVLIPEPHDLVLSKATRWLEGDEVDIGELHAVKPLRRDVLVDRYFDEMTHVLGDRSRLDLNFIECIEFLFGPVASADAKSRVRARRRR